MRRPGFCNLSGRVISPRSTMINASVIRLNSRSLAQTLCLVCAVSLAGCSLKQDMAHQPKNRPLSPSDFFTDGRSERPLLENTVARGSLANDALTVAKDSNNFPLPI